ncbi:MAG: hypothetical protein ABSG84_15545, partial [Acidobacteriaceae bacterium]
MLTMKRGLRLALLLPAAALIGCTLPSATSTSGTVPTGAWTNWQIQAGTAITSPPTGLYFIGAVQTQASQSTAVFATPGTGQPTPTTLNIVLDFLGTYDSSTGDVGLLPATTGSPAYGIAFTAPSANTVIPVSIMGGCIYPLSYIGAECNALVNLSPAVGVEIAPLTGTYVGTLTDSASPGMSGTATLTLTQTDTPNSSGQFPLSGTITFPSGSGFGTVPLGGTVSGEGITLSDSSAAPNSPTANVTASASPDASQITVSNLLYSNAGPGAV